MCEKKEGCHNYESKYCDRVKRPIPLGGYACFKRVGRGGARYDKNGWLLTGRPLGSVAKEKRKTSTISIWEDCWAYLDSIGKSRGNAVEKLIAFHKLNKDD